MTSTKVKDLLKTAWAHRVAHELDEAIAGFREVLEASPQEVEAIYGLAQSLMEQGKHKEAIKLFKTVAELLEKGALEDEIRGGMLRRQALGHVELLTKGEWDLLNIGNALPK